MPDFVERSRSALAAIREDLEAACGSLADELGAASSTEAHERLRRRLSGLTADTEQVTVALRELLARVETMQEKWLAEHRYTEAGLDALIRQQRAAVNRRRAVIDGWNR